MRAVALAGGLPPAFSVGGTLEVLLIGALAGAFVLGLGGRLAMRAVALAGGLPPAFSVGGTLEVLLIGALYGGAGGLFYELLARLRPEWHWPRAAILGVALFGFAAATSAAGRGAVAGVPQLRAVVLALFGVLFLAYGTVVHALMVRWEVRPRDLDGSTTTRSGDAG